MAHILPSRWWPMLAITGLVLVVMVTFGTAVDGDFIGLDDGNNIFLNEQLGGWSGERVAWAFKDLGSARRYLPLGWLGFSAVFTWAGLAPAGYHAASVGWHLLATVLLFGVARNILRLSADPLRPAWTTGCAALAAAAWALHPMRTEAVAWASGLLYTQASAFALASVWLWTLRWDFPSKSGWLAAGSCAGLAASLLTYPIALGLPVACWLLDFAAAKGKPAASQPASPLARYHISPGLAGLVLVAGADLAVNLAARGENAATFAATATLSDFGLLERVEQALYVWGRYLVQLAWPASLSPAYTDLYSLHPLGRGVGPTILLTVSLLGLAGWLAWRRRLSLGPVLVYSVMALPFLGLLEHPWIAHDRYATLLHPVWLVAGAGWLQGIKSHAARTGMACAALLLIGAEACAAHTLVGVWRNQASLHERLEQSLPRNAWAGYYLGTIPASVLFLEGRFSMISPQLDRAESMAPGWSAADVRKEYAGLIRQHEEFMRQNWPGRTLAPLAMLHYLHGKSAQGRQDWLTARAHFAAALRVAGDFAEARQEMAWCDRRLAGPAGK
ncbi:MAG TPA: hypothetical protein VG734_10220 [Lacunisphaera sp.]|nr:hypothetical protein [Lacunisphaera sp.]